MDTRRTVVYGFVSTAVSAGDGIQYRTIQPQPPGLQASALPGPVSAPTFMWSEFLRRTLTRVTSPSATVISGGSGGAVALSPSSGMTTESGFAGLYQGVPFYFSGVSGAISGQPGSGASTASNQIRKILVTVPMSAVPVSTFAGSGPANLTFVIGSAYTTSANAATSGGQDLSFFDYVPLPVPSAGEIPVGWLNWPNSQAASASILTSWMKTDYRVVQGLNLSALLAGVPQP